MMEFDVHRPVWVSADYARYVLQDAWIGQTSSDSYLSQLIRLGTQGVHSHSMMFRRNEDATVDVLEMLEGKGGVTKPFEYHMRKKGRIDVFSPNPEHRWPSFNPRGAVEAMRVLTAEEYGTMGLLRMALRRVPIIWRLYPPTTDDRLPSSGDSIRQPFCSHAVSLATHLGGGVDPVPRRPHWQTAPQHLTESLFYEYQFSVVTDWCRRKYSDDIDALAACNEHAFMCDPGEESD